MTFEEAMAELERRQYLALSEENWSLYFELKEESVGPPKIYLGGQMRQVQLENGVHAWTFGSAQYVRATVTNVKEYLAKRGKVLPRAKTPLPNGYIVLKTTSLMSPAVMRPRTINL